MMEAYKNLRIIFMGTPDFAVASLKKLVEAECNVVAVVTMPDKPSGRGLHLQQSAVKKYALENNIPVLQPDKLKDELFLTALKNFNADLNIVVAFRMLPEVVWNMPPLGAINLHGSLLPNYRGAAPINWAIINGEKQTGVTTFKLKHEIDTGDILLQKSFAILDTENAEQVHDKMKEIGANLLLETIVGISTNTIVEKPQQQILQDPLKLAPKIFTENCQINWNKSVEENYNFIRGLSPVPCAFAFLNGKKIKIFESEKNYETTNNTAGAVISDNKSFLHFACLNGVIAIKELQLEGKKRMPIADFLRGNKI